MKAHWQDERRLGCVLQGQVALELVEECLKQNLFWWYHELHGKFHTNGYVDVFEFMIDAVGSRGLVAGQMAEKAEGDFRHVRGGAGYAEASSREPVAQPSDKSH